MDYSQYKAAYDDDGFVVVPQFLDATALSDLKTNVDRYIRDIVPGVPETDAFYQDRDRPETLKQLHRMERDPYFAALVDSPAWRALGESLVGEPLAAVEPPEWFSKPPQTEALTPPHQDNYYFCLRPPNVLTIWVALEPVDQENGCLHYVRGSHKDGVRTHDVTSVLGFSQGINDYGPADAAREVMVELQAGDAAVHHGDTIHRTDPNLSKARQRPALAMVCRGVSAQKDEAAVAAYKESVREQQAALKVGG
jgi:phytanoyl-CoA hydroxylase